MKRLNTICAMATLLLAGVSTIVSCTKDDEQPVEGKTYHMTVTASKGGDNAKALTVDGNTISATWAQGETVTVYNVTKGAALTGTLSAQSSGDNTTLEGSLTGDIDAGDKLTLKFCSPDYSMQEGTLAYIAANCDYAEATVTVASVAGGEITASGNAAFENEQAIVKFSLLDAGGTAISASALSVTVGDVIYAAVPASATNELYVALPGISGKAVTLSAKVGGQWYNKTQPSVTFVNGQYYTVAAKLEQKGMLPGTFSVGGGKKVHFSQGNLKYKSGTWSFHTNQYDFMGGTSHSVNDSTDLFGWVGASSTALISAPAMYGVSTSETPDDYGTSGSDNLKADWCNLAISNGGNTANSGWQTLTGGDNNSAEWKYLFNTRTASTVGGTPNAHYAKATVDNKSGVILFPDVYTHPTGLTALQSVDISSAAYTTNNFNANAWAKMEAAGAVFLPAAGRRVGSSVDNAGTIGRYWSSTPGNLPYARIASVTSDYVQPVDNNRRYRGFSVRLVCPVE